jgi:uroporphyrin-III C-methyltransferase
MGKLKNISEGEIKKAGTVTLVGFGPGDPDLLTIKGLNALTEAEVIYYDDLIDKTFIHRFAGEKIYVGKRKKHHSKEQEEINQLLLKSALQGKKVVRLKGGDPMIFGHGGEEIDFLEQHQIRTNVIPGVSSGIAAAGLTKIPLTYRGVSSSVTIISGHSIDNMIIPKGGTLVLYMSVSNIRNIALKLIREGWKNSTAAAVIFNVSYEDQEVSYTSLAELVCSEKSFKTPSIIIIGEVVKLCKLQEQENQELLRTINKLVG